MTYFSSVAGLSQLVFDRLSDRRNLAAILLATQFSNQTAVGAERGPVAGLKWLEITAESLEVIPGSALDFSDLKPAGPTGRLGRVIVNSMGRMAFASSPEVPARFNCAVLSTGDNLSLHFPDHAAADRLAEQLRLHGYNLVRLHLTEVRLMRGRKRDFDFDPTELDRFRYLLAALGKVGIYWTTDVLSSSLGAAGRLKENDTIGASNLRIRVLFDPVARDHWKHLAEALLGTINPYTGRAPISDPSLVHLITVNEGGLAFNEAGAADKRLPAYPPELLPAFNRWLKNHYHMTSALAIAWGDLTADESLEAESVRFPEGWTERSERMRDTLRFVTEVERETFEWMRTTLRDLGYEGVLSAYNSWYQSAANLTRSALPSIDMHVYVGNTPSYSLGTAWSTHSSIRDTVHDYRTLASARWLGKPFTVTEYGQPFPNPHRFEAGLLVPTLAALQGWDFICRHAHSAVETRIRKAGETDAIALRPFSIGLDPIARAGETLSILLFGRGDVREATTTVAVPYGSVEALRDSGLGYIGLDTNGAALLTRFGLVSPETLQIVGDTAVAPLDRTRVPDERTDGFGRAGGRVIDGPVRRLDELIVSLRSRHLLPKDHVSDAEARIFRSSTGQFILDAGRGVASVATPRTEAIAFAGKPTLTRVGTLGVYFGTGPMLVAASSLDGEPLSASSKILLILATDVVNSNMLFDDRDHSVIRSWGSLPLLMRRETVSIWLHSERAESADLVVLGLNGEELARSPATIVDGEVRATLDPDAVSERPTTFFLLDVHTRDN